MNPSDFPHPILRLFSKRSALITFLLSTIIMGSSCAVRPKLSAAEIAAAKGFNPPSKQGFLYVYRPERLIYARVALRPVIINGQHLASNSNGTCMVIPLRPGNYNVQAAIQPYTEEQKKSGLYREIPVTIRAGKCFFIRQVVEPFYSGGGSPETTMIQTGGTPIPLMMSGSTLIGFFAEAVSEETGRRECSSLKVVGADPYDYSLSAVP